ncbi:hypothetical protein K488DRAFT_73715 [Vararia minispora EC-137]|uniref:Uncharacterized protein n=1 Tax=Vararia minispora EC-137 TaxID=1314806 RepID=A0ACB8QA76_9AGAM|nr:hypothetical protein K488DRAFT_73715 [Vararia minispora EC-137]
MGTIPLLGPFAPDYQRTPSYRPSHSHTRPPLMSEVPRHASVPLPDTNYDHTHFSIAPSTSPYCTIPSAAYKALHACLCAGALEWDIRTTPDHANISPGMLSHPALEQPTAVLHIEIPFFGKKTVTSSTHGVSVTVRDVLDALGRAFKQPVSRRILAAEPSAVVEKAKAARKQRGGTYYVMMDLQGACVYFRGLVLQTDGSFAVRLDC